jgi:hypothetical protein
MQSPVTPRRVVALGSALLLSVSLAACGDGVGPGVAAEVDGATITVDQVDDLARIICATQQGQGAAESGATPTAAVRALSLNVLLSIKVGEALGDVDSVDQQTVSQSVQAAAEARQLIDEADRDLFDEVVSDSTRAQLAVSQAAAAAVQAAGGDPTDQNALGAAAAKLQADYLDKAGVEVSTRFGRVENGQLVAGDGSLSVPVSKTALSFKGGSTDDPFGTNSEGDFPANQRCS